MKRAVVLSSAITVLLMGTAQAADTVVYDAIPASVPPNVVSLGYEATSTKEFGDKVSLGAGPRNLKKVELVLSSWACESGAWNGTCTTSAGATFTHPITLRIYNADGTGPIAEVTKSMTIPYRPSSDPVNCPSAPTTWYDPSSGTCNNGKAAVVTFDAPELSAIELPEQFIFGVAFNTRSHGYAPLGVSGPYDSLNVGVPDVGTYPIPYIGTDDTGSDGVYWYTTYAPFYCDGGAGGTSFRLDTSPGCWDPYGTIAIRFVTASPPVEVNLTGFDFPVDPVPTLNKAKSGQAIPLKFYVATEAGMPVTDLSSVNVTLAATSCSNIDTSGSDAIEQVATGGSGLINKGNGYYQFNWKTTKGTLGCQVVTLELPDGYSSTPEKLQAYFEFTK